MSHSDVSMLELFRVEVENQASVIVKGLLELERDAGNLKALQSLMRAAHSIKGAARIVNLPNAVLLAHAMEDCFTAAQEGLSLKRPHFDLLLKGADYLARIALLDESKIEKWLADNTKVYAELADSLGAAMAMRTSGNVGNSGFSTTGCSTSGVNPAGPKKFIIRSWR